MSNILEIPHKNYVHWSDTVTLHETYSKEEYNRRNDAMPSLKIQVNANLFGGFWTRRLKNIEFDLNYLKRTELYTAYTNTIKNIKLVQNKNI